MAKNSSDERQGRTLGESDFLMNIGSLNHRAVIRAGVHMDRIEINGELVIGVLLDLLKGLLEEKLVICAPYRFLRLPNLPVMLTVLECT